MAAAAPVHQCRLIASPVSGVYATDIRSGRHLARHAHASFVLGVVDAGAQRSTSGRGTVDAFAGDLLAANPGDVHDGLERRERDRADDGPVVRADPQAYVVAPQGVEVERVPALRRRGRRDVVEVGL